MRISIVCAALAAALAGCHQPFQVWTRVTSCNEVDVHMPPRKDAGPLVEMPVMSAGCDSHARIALIDVDGLLLNEERTGLWSLGENPVAIFREKLDHVAARPYFRGVVLRINSPGGSVTSADIMWRDLLDFKQRTGLPVVACVMDVGAGGAYYLATGADWIVAHPTSLVGGVGVILNLYNLQDAMQQFNVIGVPVKAGDKIDIGSPIRGAPPDTRDILQQIAEQFHMRFIQVVQERRPGTVAAPPGTFDGRIFTAEQAHARQLIDGIGYLDEAVAQVRESGGCPTAAVVMLHRRNDPAHSPYAASPNTPLHRSLVPLHMPGLERERLPAYLYLWQPEPMLPVTDKP